MKIKKNLDCLFCQIVANKETMAKEKKIYLVGENEEAIAILDKFPASNGHALLITKKHFANISKVEEESWKHLLPLMKEIISKLEAVFKPAGFNIISNMNEDNEKKIAYQSIFHLHIHIIPKYTENEGFIWTVKNKKPADLIQIAKKLGVINN